MDARAALSPVRDPARALEAARVDPSRLPTLRILENVADGPGPSMLRRLALQSQADCPREDAFGTVWREIEEGRLVVRDHFDHEQRWYLILAPCAAPAATQLHRARDAEIMRRIMLGEVQKIIALDLGISASTVAVIARRNARSMGLESSATRLPTVLLMAAYACYRSSTLRGRFSSTQARGASYEVVSVERLTTAALQTLSAAEQTVVDLLLDRRTNAEIASIPCTSARTVANQLSTVLGKLRARGRSEIILKLIEAAERAKVGAK